jgi:flagellar FliL protein
MKLKKSKKPADGETPKGGKGNLVPAVVLALGLVGGGFLFGGKGAAPAPAAAAPAAAEEEAAEQHGPVVPVDPITLNLADEHYLKVGLALQLKAADEGEAASGDHSSGGTEEEPMAEGETAKALDAAISLLGQQTMAQLSNHEVRAQVKQQLAEQISEAYDGAVTGVYFTEFVMQ